jgi:hypothetical protein
MFNIHALREQWDLLTIALKLPKVVGLLTERLGKAPNERELSAETGLAQGVIRRCKLLMELPAHHQQAILEELKKPKSKQKLTEDFYIEMERALKTVMRAMPGVLQDSAVEHVRTVLIDKYRKGVITNLVHFRMLAKIARAENVSADRGAASKSLKKIFSSNSYSIEDGYRDSVGEAYIERDLVARVSSLSQFLEEVEWATLDSDSKKELRRFYKALGEFIRGN